MSRAMALVLAGGLFTACLGFGGFDVGLGFPDYSSLDSLLTGLNREWGGSEPLGAGHPWVWLGGHGAGLVGDISIGGRGALTGFTSRADSVEMLGGGARLFLETGYVWSPIEQLWVRPVVEAGGDALLHYIHDNGSPFEEPNFSRWYVGWSLGVAPGVEVMGRLRRDIDKYVGLFIKAHYYIPVYGENWYVDENPPAFDLQGIHLQVGLRFGRMPPTRLRI